MYYCNMPHLLRENLLTNCDNFLTTSTQSWLYRMLNTGLSFPVAIINSWPRLKAIHLIVKRRQVFQITTFHFGKKKRETRSLRLAGFDVQMYFRGFFCMSCMSKLCILGICPCDSTCTVCRKGTVYMYQYLLVCLVINV